MESGFSLWQALTVSSIFGWVIISSLFDFTKQIRSIIQPLVARQILAEIPFILKIQKLQNGFLDNFFSLVSCVVSVPFYTGFLPLLFWSGHGKLARQMTLLLSFCDYIGNCIKDVVSAPRPSSPPVRRLTSTKDEKQHAMEYGLPSSHALNTVCLTGYLLHYVLTYGAPKDGMTIAAGFSIVCLFVMLVGISRIYLGMHSLIDIVAGICFGLIILAFWLFIHGYVDSFIISGQNMTTFCVSLSILLCFAYPTPEFPTPSFEFHTAFTGVAFGIVMGVQQTYTIFHHEKVPRIFTPQLSLQTYIFRILIGIPVILTVKSCGKAISKWLLPIVCNTLGIPIVSSCYVPSLKGNSSKEGQKSTGYVQRLFCLFPQKDYDVDTGIRFVQYASLAWSVVDLVPSLFGYLNL